MNEEIKKRDWSYSELARRMGVVPSNVSMVLNGHLKPTWDFCAAVSRAINLPPEEIFRRAGLLPSLPGQKTDTHIQELLEMAKGLSEDDRRMVLEIVRVVYEQRKG